LLLGEAGYHRTRSNPLLCCRDRLDVDFQARTGKDFVTLHRTGREAASAPAAGAGEARTNRGFGA
jgi:hypothetical protein